MKRFALTLMLLYLVSLGFTQSKLPYLKNGQLWVDNSPHLMIAGELHNSTASSIEYMDSIWPRLKSLNLNTVLATVSWDQFEPEEGEYNFQMIDYLVSNAYKNGLKLVVVWFGSWKNGQSSYAPLWVKKDTQRFPRVQTKDRKQVETLSVFSDETKKADARAFTTLMKRIREIDNNQTVIMVQPENEVGIFQDIDYRREALNNFESDVPYQLITYLKKNKEDLKKEVKSVWDVEGNKTSGTWKEVFGDNPQAKEFFMAWYYARYINYIAESGRREYDIPMFVNAWIVQQPNDLPGIYPNGGPVSRVMDIYKAAAQSIDIICPDIYLPDYQEICEMYIRKDNPLLVPESTLDPARAFYVFAEYNAICFSPFGIEDAAGNILFSESYKVLNELRPFIAKYQNTGKMRGVHLTRELHEQQIEIEGRKIQITIQDPDLPAFGLIIKTGDNEFLVSGMNFKLDFNQEYNDKITYIGQVIEGRFENNRWIDIRWLNGDETYHHELFRALGRKQLIGDSFHTKNHDMNTKEGDPFVYSPGEVNSVTTPGIYKVSLYER